MTAEILEYFDACFGDGVGTLHIACGWGIHLGDSGKFKHEQWIETRFAYPAERERAARELIQSAAAGADTYVCPYLTFGDKRGKGTAIGHVVLHADVDTDFDLEKIHAVGGCAITSGTEKHVHVYVQLAEKVPPHHHTALERALVAYLGGDPAKISDNDVLRPPGTVNRKPTVDGKEPAPVGWLIHPNGHRADPQKLATVLGAALPDRAPPPTVLPVIGTAETVTLAQFPTVLVALSRITGDRSEDTARVVGACYDSHLTLAQARWVINTRIDLAQRLAERRDDDVGITWAKIDDDRRKKKQLNYWGTGPAIIVAGDTPPVIDDSGSALEILEGGFWDARESLKTIWTSALARMSSPWAVLAYCVARALTHVRPNAELPHLINRGSLNWFGAVTAGSAGGKGSAGFAARQLVPGPHMVNIGSGEGLVLAYGKCEDGTPENEAIMFNVDEVDILAAMTLRTASTTMSVLRSGFSGETLGFSYAAKEKRRHIEAGKYRMTLMVSVQPERAGGLFGDAGGGTPQRFMWFPGTDTRITNDPPWPCGPLELPHPSEWTYPREIFLPDTAKQLILDERAKSARGEIDALDGHALFSRTKFAYALAVLDNRVQMTLEDWELSHIAANVSMYTRTKVQDELQWATERDAHERGRIRGIELYAAKREQEFDRPAKVHQRQQRVERLLLEKIMAAKSDGITNRELNRSIAARDRDIMNERLEALKQLGSIAQLEGTTRWVAR